MKIRHWKKHDTSQLRILMMEFLKEHDKYGSDIALNWSNVDWLVELGLMFSKKEEPTYLMEDEKGKILGFMLAGPMTSDLKLKWKTLQAFGSYTLPSQRGRQIYVQLIQATGKRMLELGYERGVSTVYLANRRVLDIAFQGDVWPSLCWLEWRATPQEFWKPLEEKKDVVGL